MTDKEELEDLAAELQNDVFIDAEEVRLKRAGRYEETMTL